MEVIAKQSRNFLPRALLVKPSGPPTQDPYTQLFLSLIVVLLLTHSEFSCLAMLAKRNPVPGPTLLPQVPNHFHCVRKSAHEVLGTILRT